MQEFEGIDRRISGIVPYPDGYNTVIGCTDNGQLNFWSCQSGIITKKLVWIIGHNLEHYI